MDFEIDFKPIEVDRFKSESVDKTFILILLQ